MPHLRNAIRIIAETGLRVKKELLPTVTEEVGRTIKAQNSRAIVELEVNIESHRQLEQAWKDRVEEQKSKFATTGDQSVELEFARGDLQRSDEVFQKIRSEQDVAAILLRIALRQGVSFLLGPRSAVPPVAAPTLSSPAQPQATPLR